MPITLQEVLDYIEREGPKKGIRDRYSGRVKEETETGFILSKIPFIKRRIQFVDSFPLRIEEIIPQKGLVELISNGRNIIFHDPQSQRFFNAGYDIENGEVVPLEEKPFELSGYKRNSIIKTVYFCCEYNFGGGAQGTASFLWSLIDQVFKTTDATIIEIGQTGGDTCSRRFHYVTYNKN